MTPETIDLTTLSEGELMELLVPSGSMNRRVLVMWLYLKSHPDQPLDQFDDLISSLAEKELQKRAGQGTK